MIYQRKFKRAILYRYLLLVSALILLPYLFVAIPLFLEALDICSGIVVISVVAIISMSVGSFIKSRNEPLVEITDSDLIINDVIESYPRENTDNKTIPLENIETLGPSNRWGCDIQLKSGRKVFLPVSAVRKSDQAALIPSIEEAIKSKS